MPKQDYRHSNDLSYYLLLFTTLKDNNNWFCYSDSLSCLECMHYFAPLVLIGQAYHLAFSHHWPMPWVRAGAFLISYQLSEECLSHPPSMHVPEMQIRIVLYPLITCTCTQREWPICNTAVLISVRFVLGLEDIVPIYRSNICSNNPILISTNYVVLE